MTVCAAASLALAVPAGLPAFAQEVPPPEDAPMRDRAAPADRMAPEGAVPPDPSPEEGARRDDVPALMARLREADPAEARGIDRELRLIWSRSGSAAMDLLLQRGRDSLDAGDFPTAIGHLSALIDHAPDFAEAYHARAQAYFRSEEFGLALADLQQALALNPDHFAVVYGMSVILEQIGREAEAHDGFSAILDIYPAHRDAAEGRDRLSRAVTGLDI
ncbi:tetratricopeptide repeat protein [Pseudooceanicola aestuarii]|uniref:tetratricopeptide repeat protein n=1 Tax=Pseudooceanicola aestuarii TaxID=2697319 RepID=UPI001EF81BDA|nr:tetratricopeptide repeat protein [Pseudooceanicola aestuarii]